VTGIQGNALSSMQNTAYEMKSRCDSRLSATRI